MKQAAAIIKNGWRLSNSCLRTTFRGSRFNSIGQLLTLRSASPTTSPNKCSDRASSATGAGSAAANWNAPRENSGRLDKEKICRAGSDIHEQRTATQVAVTVAERVIKRHWRGIDDRCAQPRLFNRIVDLIEQVNFNRDQYDLNWLVATASHELVIPDDLVDWEGNILLRLERNNFLDLFFINRRQFHKTSEN